MSGTLGFIRKQQKQQEQIKRKALQQNQKNITLKQNREQIIAEICNTFGWTELDDFAKKMIDDAFSGKFVDVKQLKKDLSKWKETKEQSSNSSSLQESENASLS